MTHARRGEGGLAALEAHVSEARHGAPGILLAIQVWCRHQQAAGPPAARKDDKRLGEDDKPWGKLTNAFGERCRWGTQKSPAVGQGFCWSWMQRKLRRGSR